MYAVYDKEIFVIHLHEYCIINNCIWFCHKCFSRLMLVYFFEGILKKGVNKKKESAVSSIGI